GRGRLGADVLDGAAGDLRPDQGLDGVEQPRVAHEGEGGRAARLHDVHALDDLRRLRVEAGDAALERLALAEIADLALTRQFPRAAVDPGLVLGDHRREVLVAQQVYPDEDALLAKGRHLFR